MGHHVLLSAAIVVGITSYVLAKDADNLATNSPPGGSIGTEIKDTSPMAIHIQPRYYRWFVDPGVEWTEKKHQVCGRRLEHSNYQMCHCGGRCVEAALFKRLRYKNNGNHTT